MQYTSTRNKNVVISAAQAIAQGISNEGGLFVPTKLPQYTTQRLEGLIHKSYVERACDILSDFLTDFTPQEIHSCVVGAYGTGKFDDEKIAPMAKLSPDTYMLELWHGPTCAFKDMALQLLPHLLTTSMKKVGQGKEAAILVATSGDTGKAALEGFRDVPGTKILVFYPEDGVSKVQKLQMQTQEGENVGVCGVFGNFDDTQSGVKSIFTNLEMQEKLDKSGMMFSSANSINWGRLVPQIVYYISAYCDLVESEEIALGDTLNVVVPTGNFGNILAAYYAKRMGLPIGRLVCASNVNNVLTDFIQTGQYNRNREFYMTSSPSMDILISSNLERLLFALYEEDDKQVAQLMDSLAKTGSYTVSNVVKEKLNAEFFGGYCDEASTSQTIRTVFHTYDYLCDTHTAVAKKVHEDYVAQTGDKTKALIASTASPYKFSASILAALTQTTWDMDEFAQAKELSNHTKTQIPQQILDLENKSVRFESSCATQQMTQVVAQTLGI